MKNSGQPSPIPTADGMSHGSLEIEGGEMECAETLLRLPSPLVSSDRHRAICTNSFIIGIALLFHRPSENPSPTVPSQKSINESHRAQRASPFRNQHPFCNPLGRLAHVVLLQKRFALCLAPRRMRAAFFAYFFLLLKKSRSPKASKATNDAFGPNVLEKRAPSVRVGVYQNLVSFNFRSN